MKDITKNNLDEFINYYHSLHDSYITNINYDINNSKIELLIDVCWSGDPILKDDDTYETNKTKIKMILYNINKFSVKEMASWDYIDEVFINYITYLDKEYICFATDKEEPLLYIVCEDIEYEEIK